MNPSSSPKPSRSSAVYTISGMTCDHCIISVTEEVAEIPFVDAISVDLDSGVLRVTGEGFTDDAVRGAVSEAGYEVVS
jgi:copper chaperone CopZ